MMTFMVMTTMMYMNEVERIQQIRDDMCARGEPLHISDVNELTLAITKEDGRIRTLYKTGWITSDEKAKLIARLRRLTRRTYALSDIDWVIV